MWVSTPAAALPTHVSWRWPRKLLAAQEHIAFVRRHCAQHLSCEHQRHQLAHAPMFCLDLPNLSWQLFALASTSCTETPTPFTGLRTRIPCS